MNHKGRLRSLVSFVSLLVIVFCAVPAHAELVFFSSGRNLSVKSHHLEGGSLVLTLRGGGEMTCDAALVARIEADEVAYPEPEDLVRLQPDTTSLVRPQPDLLAVDTRYTAIIDKFSAEQGVPARLVRAVIQVESAYQENARSKKGAMGLMQLMPETARQYAVRNPYDPAANIEAGVKHLKSLLDRLPLSLALAAYNAGEASVQRFSGIPPYPETRNYVNTVLRLISR
jgi:soluble lytic murein transglycosylase-like protein